MRQAVMTGQIAHTVRKERAMVDEGDEQDQGRTRRQR
jgi:hypothetical protein